MRELTLVIPGLLWPADSIAEVTADLALPALSTLLATEAVTRLAAQPIEHLLATSWGLAADAAPYAALRLAGSGLAPGDAIWMCADPAHLRFARESLVLADDRELQISDDEAAQLVASLNEAFADIGEFSVGSAGEWYLRLAELPALTTHPASQVLGRNIEAWLPEGAQAKAWRRTINEIQVLLHGHPVNAAREEAGRPAINTLWPWGAGRLVARLARSYDTVFANLALARGLAEASGAKSASLPQRLPETDGGRMLAVVDQLDCAALSQDAPAWRAAIADVDANWLAPALNALKAGAIGKLRLLLPGDAACLDIGCSKPAWWKFGRASVVFADFVNRYAAP